MAKMYQSALTVVPITGILKVECNVLVVLELNISTRLAKFVFTNNGAVPISAAAAPPVYDSE